MWILKKALKVCETGINNLKFQRHFRWLYWWISYNNNCNPTVNVIHMDSAAVGHSSPGCWTWSPTRWLGWLDRTAAARAARAGATAPREARPARKSPSLRTTSWWGWWCTAGRRTPDTTTPSSRTDGRTRRGLRLILSSLLAENHCSAELLPRCFFQLPFLLLHKKHTTGD